MRKMSLLLALMLTLVGLAWAQTCEMDRMHGGLTQSKVLPTPDASGEYRRQDTERHPFWEVVAEGGLNGHAPSVSTDDVSKRPVVRVFPQGTILTATCGPQSQTGFILLIDALDHNWLMVESGDQQYCLVRANRQYIRPVTSVPCE